MKKNIVILLLAILTIPLAAFDWGGVLDNNTAVKGAVTDMGLDQTDRLTLWFRTPINESSYLVGEAFYEFNYLEASDKISHILDLNLLKFSMSFLMDTSGTLNLNLGRYGIRDFSGIILSQPSDGIEVRYANDTVVVAAYVGFTGLLNNLSVEISGGQNPIKASAVYTLAPPYIITSLSAQFPYLFAQQSLATGFYATVDVGNENTKNHRMYATALLNGPISSSFFYIFSSSLGIITDATNEWQLSNLSAFEITNYLPFLSSSLSWKTVFATGPQGDNAGFETFTVATANIDDTLYYGGNIKTGIRGTLRPIDSLLVSAGADVFFTVMNDGSDEGYAGMQWTFSTRWQIMGDVQLSVSAGQFFSAKENIDPYMLANVGLLLSF